ncbi:serine hydrolase domain-containing protein [Sphingobacterium sp. SGG-5]|uniref:serine hydrolase domain-containing protein n=1 Tax=Sphingobacterium sp. SGG-5 TaxID=2710881 RepID=UPI001F0ED17F|nr:beta-lactamase family protein [Sphingobacterium sp. SGG-5]
MNKFKMCITLLCALPWLYHMPVSAQSNQEELEDELKMIMAENNGIGMAVVVVKDNKLVYNKSLGYSDLEKKTPLKDDNIFRIASISKSFTTSCLLKLVEKGEISLQDNVSDLIGFPVVNPNFPDKVITLEMLLSHTSSMNDSQRYSSLDIINPAKNPTYAKSYSDYPPGAKHVYCNMGYNLAGAILEKLHGKRFDVVIREQILTPLGIQNAGFNIDSLDHSKFASLYVFNSKTQDFTKSTRAYLRLDTKDYVIGYSGARFSPTGGMKISALDLATYMQMHMNYGIYQGHRIVPELASCLMQKPFAKVSDTRDYGLAIRIARDLIAGETMIGHTGSASGLRSAMFFEPHKKFGFVVIITGMDHTMQIDGYVALQKQAINTLYDHFIQK